MARLLFLAHRLPYPPNKGDKVRSYHLLRHLLARHEVHVGTFVDDPEDEAHVPTLARDCASLFAPRLHPRRARAASLTALLDGRALTLRYYQDTAMARWVRRTVAERRIDAVVVFCSAMAQYAEGLGLPTLVDFVDVDSAKWTQFATDRGGPLAWLYRREGERLLVYEREVAARFQRSYFVTERETELFRSLAPECAGAVDALANGVDAEFFAPDAARASPYPAGAPAVAFTGAMDYWPNVDAVVWFVQEALPALRAAHPGLRLHVVGRNPAPAVRALAGEAVAVTGTVPDVRPYLQHADVVVAPLRLARGIQNKVLEAMAMARPVVAATGCGSTVGAVDGREIVLAEDAPAFVHEVGALLADPARASALGAAGRERVLADYSWGANLARIDDHLAAALAARAA
ncbi:sugar transferase (PEP-CTERM/EpsH1 system associated) [Rubrivivax gelatinosus]|uniref:TIGR03087 family PEP-CTERM/XrtA system glycosyltransferase n=2 Tax=Rubrivivax gelatinosus TaxID=28068 RepID=UPI0018CB65DD|nr:TIGR03087 family PEP-CTERM/XrtA system glycosyltransferase [Rubrivivax gelatinosus]MBG6080379.1 sugar transferase (PEP-CTERM/EpsH1 system associated) [Rubrivivax gelatinosus]